MGFNPDSWYRGSVLTPTPTTASLYHCGCCVSSAIQLHTSPPSDRGAVGLEQRFLITWARLT